MARVHAMELKAVDSCKCLGLMQGLPDMPDSLAGEHESFGT